ncbi:polyprenyl synthetase family protein [Nocardia terrae]|uniref:polyprenyl synthetase family protein n=1 Tax=Nocardia terrae TaxID=2675851 RepID=UPI001F272490|nr:polyprenyl synthetase family protein [Nocardia terrae]
MTVTTFIPPARRPAEILARARTLLDPVLRESVLTLPEPMRHLAGYHFGWWDERGNPMHADPGKMLRPALVTSTAFACDGGAGPAATAAAAVELVHNFTLIHDDVMDADPVRRGRPAVWRVWGMADAVLLGDALHALATNVLAALATPRTAMAAIERLETTVTEMCRGQHADCHGDAAAASLAGWESTAMGKTGALFGCACALGALSAGADDETVCGFDRFGRDLGVAFQAVDDILGVWGDPARSGKPTADLAHRKRGLPIVLALESGTAAGCELAELYQREAPLSPQEIVWAARLVDKAGGRRGAERLARRRLRSALAALPNGSGYSDLVTLAHLVAHRNR